MRGRIIGWVGGLTALATAAAVLALPAQTPAQGSPAVAGAGHSGAAPQQATPDEFELALVPGEGELLLRGAAEPFLIDPATSLSGTVDTETGAISDASLSTPTISFQQEITTPVVATVFIDATFSEASPGSGTVDSEGNITVQTAMAVDLHIEVGDPPFLTSDCRATPIDLTLASTAPYDPDTRTVTLAATNFSVPSIEASPTCSSLVVPAINEQLAGGGHSLTMTVSGELELPAEAGDPTLTVLTVTPGGTSPLGRDIEMVATVSPADGTPTEPQPTGSVDFLDGATVLATVPLDGVIADFTTSSLALGRHELTARYRGDLSFAGSRSAVVGHQIVAAPLLSTNSTLPESVQIGASAREFDLQVTNSGLGADVRNARVDVTIQRVQGTGEFTPERVTLQTLSGGVWEPVSLLPGAARAVMGSVGPPTGFELVPNSSHTLTLRLGFPNVGTPSPTACGALDATCPGPVRVTFEIVQVDPGTGAPAVAQAPRTDPVAAASTAGVLTMTEAQLRPSTIAFRNPILGQQVFPHTVRQGNTVSIPMTQVGPNVAGVTPTGLVEFYLDGILIPARDRVAPLSVPFGPTAPVSRAVDLLLPPNAPTGPRNLTIRYLGDPLFAPSQSAPREITVVQAAGPAYECLLDTAVSPVRYGANVVVDADVRRLAPAGGEVLVNDLNVSMLVDRGSISNFQSIRDGEVTEVGSEVLEAIEFGFGPDGTGTAGAVELTGSVVMPANPYPATEVDETLAFVAASASIPVNVEPGEVLALTLDSIVLRLRTAAVGLPQVITCTPVGQPARLAQVTAAGTTLSVTPAGPVQAGSDVTLRADVAPAGSGFVVFRDGTRDIGVVPVVNGTATMTTDDLTVGSHDVTARFFGGLTVPSTVSDPVAVEVTPPALSVAPATELLDGAPMSVTVSNAASGVSYTLATCKGEECATGQQVTAGPGSTVTATVPAVQRFTSTGGRHMYCRADCEVVVRGPVDSEARAGFAMAAGSLTVAPSTGLSDGQAIQVIGTGLMPTYNGPPFWVFGTGGWALAQCDRAVQDELNLVGVFFHCAAPTQAVTVVGSTLDLGQPVQATIDKILGGTTDCTQPSACVMALVRLEQDGSTSGHLVPIEFGTG